LLKNEKFPEEDVIEMRVLMSLFPPRCFTCGKVLRWGPYEKLIKGGKGPDSALDSLGMRRTCCRRMYKGHNPQIEEDLLLYDSGTNQEIMSVIPETSEL